MSHVTLDDKTVKKLIQASLDILKDCGYFTHCLWHVEDIHLLCEQRNWPTLTHEEAKAIFAIFAELYEGDQGMTWSKLEQAVEVYLAQQGKVKGMQTPTRSLSVGSIEELVQNEVLDERAKEEQ